MLNKTVAVGLLFAILALATFSDSADAKRRCPRGSEDVHDVCIPHRR